MVVFYLASRRRIVWRSPLGLYTAEELVVAMPLLAVAAALVVTAALFFNGICLRLGLLEAAAASAAAAATTPLAYWLAREMLASYMCEVDIAA